MEGFTHSLLQKQTKNFAGYGNGAAQALGMAGHMDEDTASLLWDVPCSPNAGTWNLNERVVGGHSLVAFGVGRRLMIMSKQSFSVLHVSSEMLAEVQAVAWSGATALPPKAAQAGKHSEAGEKPLTYGIVAAGCSLCVRLIVAEGASAREAFPFSWKPLATISLAAAQGESPSGMHLAVRAQEGLMAVSDGCGLRVWRIPEASTAPGALPLTDPPVWVPTIREKDKGRRPVLHSAFSTGSHMLSWVEAGISEVRILALNFPQPDDDDDTDGPTQVQKEVMALEERLPECMRRNWRGFPLEGRSKEVGRREWAIGVGKPCIQVAWAKAHHFASMPETRTLLAMREDFRIMVLLICVAGRERRLGTMLLSGLCSSIHLPPESGPYRAWWTRESASRHAPASPAHNPQKVKEIKDALGGRELHTDCEEQDWWSSIQQSVVNVDQTVPDWLSGLKQKQSPKRSHVMVHPPVRDDKDWIVCVGRDGKAIVCSLNFHLQKGVLDPDHNQVQIVQTLQLVAAGAHTSADWCLVASSLSVASPNASGLPHVDGGAPAFVNLMTIGQSWAKTRRSLVLLKLDLGTEVAVEEQHYVAHTEVLACVAAHSTQQYVATCSVSGEALIWRCDEAPASCWGPPLVCAASLKGAFRCLAWSPALERSVGLWDAGLLWALTTDGSAVEGFCVEGAGRERAGKSIGSVCRLELPKGVQAEDWTPGSSRTAVCCHLRVTPLYWNKSHSSPSSRACDPKAVSPGDVLLPADVHLVTAVIGESFYFWMVGVILQIIISCAFLGLSHTGY